MNTEENVSTAEQRASSEDELSADPATATGDEAPTVESLTEALEKARAEAHSNWERCLRTAAELDNVRKRAARDVEHAHKYALEGFARDLLGVRDSLEMGLAAARESSSLEAFLEGTEATLRQFAQAFDKFGIEEVEPTGQPFDPNLHEAMTMMVSDEVETEQVQTVVQKGYTLNGRLLRPARVIVARPAPAAPAGDAGATPGNSGSEATRDSNAGEGTDEDRATGEGAGGKG